MGAQSLVPSFILKLYRVFRTMLIFDQLRISDDGRRLYINMHVNEASYFENVFLDSITITTADKVLEAYGSSNTDPTVTATDYIYRQTFEGAQKEAALVLDKGSFDAAFSHIGSATATYAFNASDLSTSLFFVYVKCKLASGATLDPCIPCTLDEEVTLGVTFDTNALYQKVMGYTRELADDCSIPTGFIDFILNFNAFKAAIETQHFIPAINFWQTMFGNKGAYGISSFNATKKCGCHG